MEGWLSGRKRHTANVLSGTPGPRVRIPPLPHLYQKGHGEMAERFKAAVLKTVEG